MTMIFHALCILRPKIELICLCKCEVKCNIVKRRVCKYPIGTSLGPKSLFLFQLIVNYKEIICLQRLWRWWKTKKAIAYRTSIHSLCREPASRSCTRRCWQNIFSESCM